MGASPAIPDSLKGPAWMLLSCVAFVAIWVLVRILSGGGLHPFVIVFFRTLFAIVAFLPFLLRHGRDGLVTANLPLNLFRGVLSLVATLGIFYSVAHIPLEEAVAISYAAPVFAAIGAILILKEKVRWRRIAALAIGLVGVLLILRPGFREVTPGVLAAIIGAVAIAGSLVVIKRLSGTDRPEAIALYALLVVLPGSLLVALPFWSWPDAGEAGLLVLIGILVAIGHTALGRAFRLSEATAVLPLDFSRLILASFIGVFVLGEPADTLVWVGAIIILASTVYVAHREAVMAKAPSAKKLLKPLAPPVP